MFPDAFVFGRQSVRHVFQSAIEGKLRSFLNVEVRVGRQAVFLFLVGGGGFGIREEHGLYLLLALHVHDEHLALRGVERVAVRFVYFHLLELHVGHVLQRDGDVVLEESVAVEPHFLNAAPLVGELFLPVVVPQSGQAAHQLDQHRPLGHLVGIHVEHGGVSFLVHFLQFADDLRLFQRDGVAVQHDAVQTDLVGRPVLVLRLHGGADAVQRVHADVGDDDSDFGLLHFLLSPNVVLELAFEAGGCGAFHLGGVGGAVGLHVGAFQRERFFVELIDGKDLSFEIASERIFFSHPGTVCGKLVVIVLCEGWGVPSEKAKESDDGKCKPFHGWNQSP